MATTIKGVVAPDAARRQDLKQVVAEQWAGAPAPGGEVPTVTIEVPTPGARNRRRDKWLLLLLLIIFLALAFAGWWRKEQVVIEEMVDRYKISNRDYKLNGILPAPGVLKRMMDEHVGRLCDEIFDEVDHDGDRRLDSAEVHVAVLLVYNHLNRLLGGLALDAPGAEEVKALVMLGDRDNDGELTRREFREAFADKFLHRLTARVTARLLVRRVLVPLGALGLHALQDNEHLRYQARRNVERWMASVGKMTDSFHPFFLRERRLAWKDSAAIKQITSTTSARLIPWANLQLAHWILKLFRVEPLLAVAFGAGTHQELVQLRKEYDDIPRHRRWLNRLL